MRVQWRFSSDKEAGANPALPRNCEGNENLGKTTGLNDWEGEVSRPPRARILV